MVIFKSKQKKSECDLKIKLCGKRVYPTESVKYLGVKIALLLKMRKYISLKISRFIYFAILDSYLSYCSLFWAQNYSTIQRIIVLEKRLLELLISNHEIPIPVPYSKKLYFKISR